MATSLQKEVMQLQSASCSASGAAETIKNKFGHTAEDIAKGVKGIARTAAV